MEKQDHAQLELFNRPTHAAADPHRREGFSRAFISQIWRYEKAVLIAISLLVTGVAAFSIGFEKGRRQALRTQSPSLKAVVAAEPVTPKSVETAVVPLPAEQQEKSMAPPKQEARNFTIQVASYKAASMAKKEAEALKKKGYQTHLLPSSNNYTALCVGSFETIEGAKTVLLELKKRYRDCFIRRL